MTEKNTFREDRKGYWSLGDEIFSGAICEYSNGGRVTLRFYESCEVLDEGVKQFEEDLTRYIQRRFEEEGGNFTAFFDSRHMGNASDLLERLGVNIGNLKDKQGEKQ